MRGIVDKCVNAFGSILYFQRLFCKIRAAARAARARTNADAMRAKPRAASIFGARAFLAALAAAVCGFACGELCEPRPDPHSLLGS